MTHTATAWQEHGACRDEDPDLFFPAGTTGPYAAQTEEAKSICRRCPVMERCAAWALETREAAGIWGGLTENERNRIHRRQTRHFGMTLAQAAVDPRAQPPAADLFAARIRRDGTHTLWIPKSTSLSVQGRNRTPRQLAFYLAYGRWPDGTVRGTCGVLSCLTGDHITDATMRRAATIPEHTDLSMAA
ncbi:Transcription factor WhiB [Streptomyces sp. ScaeMP-e48]|nr:Transcription factor WhiB [Streptomyces sp. ScaeMP-e48]